MHLFAQMVKEDPNVPIARNPVFGYAEVANPEDRKHDAEMKEHFPTFRPRFPLQLSSLSDLLSPTTGVRLGLEHVARDGSITELTSGSLTFNASALVNCTGLGALFLGDVNDTAMFPTRGETVLLRAPHPSPRPEMVKFMKEHGIAVTDDLDVIEDYVGLRPTRRGGVRVETSWLDGEKEIPVVHNYGHAGGGYESSWASAHLAVELLQTALKG
ncbi:hypothetical protein B0H13DRAFT_2168525 [Mycena leptocephala]|nr:hypothetical protein B0H13DRAFT_2168525 [Mycena leptocephala]